MDPLKRALYELGFLNKKGDVERNKERRWNQNINEAELILKDFMKDIADLVIEDIKKRKKMGKAKYGVPLRAHNGRNALQDAYEEAQDLSLYLKQRLVEEERLDKLWEDEDTMELEYALSLMVARAVFDHYLKETKYLKKNPAQKKDIIMQFPVWVAKEIEAVENSVGEK